jgi:hypothetical protein
MIPARDLQVTPFIAPAQEPRGPIVHAPQYATISTADGRYVTGGMATFAAAGAGWRATLVQLDRPGHVASMYFAGGVREVLLRLDDGRSARARITGTSFIASAERVCELSGLEQLV